jgi:arylsulfatase A-like enzyme
MIDFYPTLSELAGISYPGFVAGKSIVPVLEDASATIRESALSQISTDYMRRIMDPTYGYTIRTTQYRYTRWEEGGEGMIEFYNRMTDPAEMINLAKDPRYKDIIRKMDAELQERIIEASVDPKGITVLKPEE